MSPSLPHSPRLTNAPSLVARMGGDWQWERHHDSPGSGGPDIVRRLRYLMEAMRVFWVFAMMLAATAVAGDANAKERVSLQLKWRHQFQFAGYYAALAKGYYRDAGLEVDLIEAAPEEDPVAAVLRGEAEFGVGTSELLLLRGKGRPVVVLATIFQHSPLVFIAKGSSTETDLQGLYHKPLMIEPQSAEIFAYFRNEGMDPAHLNIVHHSFSVEDLLHDRVAAMTGYSTDEPFLLQQAGVEFSVFSPRAGGIDFYGDNLFTTESVIRTKPAVVKAFREASLRGWEYALAHPEEIIDLIIQKYGSLKSREHLRFEAERTAQLMHPGLIEIGHMNQGRWRHIAEIYAEFGMLPQDFDVTPMLYEADPPPDLRPWYWAFGILVAVAAAALGWIAPLMRLNRRLRQSECQYRQLAEHAPFPVLISNLETDCLVFANILAADLLGGRPDQLVSRRAVEFYANPEDRVQVLADLESGKATIPRELRLRAMDGREFWALMTSTRVEFNGHRCIEVAFHDVTERRNMQEALQRAKEEAETANAARRRYMAVMSHDIRTPMNGIFGLADYMLNDDEQPLNADQRQNLVMIGEASQNLIQLVTQMLDWSQLEADAMKLDIQAVPLRELLANAVGLFRPSLEAKGVNLKLEVTDATPETVMTDPLRLRQILSNLVSNAVKFTAQGEVCVKCSASRLVDGRWQLSFAVSDTGPGMTPEVQAKLFAPYMQAEAAVARTFGGSGLGLSISKELARLLDGDISLQSQIGSGSTFTLNMVADD